MIVENDRKRQAHTYLYRQVWLFRLTALVPHIGVAPYVAHSQGQHAQGAGREAGG
jgi:hypothetical protein